MIMAQIDCIVPETLIRWSSLPALFVFCTKSRRAERYWQKTLVQMEEMESQIRDEIRRGNWVASDQRDSDVLEVKSVFGHY